MRQWANLGYPRRALWLHRAAVEIRDRHDGVVPRDVDALLALTGIGDYTARRSRCSRTATGIRSSTRTRAACSPARSTDARSPARRRDGTSSRWRRSCPTDDAEAAVVNAATMELGATVCIARVPRCDACPIADRCAWRAAGYPDTGDGRRRQARYEGSDRQARGAVLKVLRDAAAHAVPLIERRADWPDALSATGRSTRSSPTGWPRHPTGMLPLPALRLTPCRVGLVGFVLATSARRLRRPRRTRAA